ncbi:MAG TPA: allene oxide cyclase family protein [Steroidobacteraceae bacterium]|nr:allene oxide cyclase family protein [Steroidobacteraceae bacterium]
MRRISLGAAACALYLLTPALAGERLHVIEHALTDSVLDLGAKGDSAGDLLTFANPVYDAADKTQVGSDQGYCVRVAVGKSWECFWTLILKQGEITIEGPFYDHGDSLLAITGGTGKYVGARGSLALHPRDAKGSSYDFVYELL